MRFCGEKKKKKVKWKEHGSNSEKRREKNVTGNDHEGEFDEEVQLHKAGEATPLAC